MPQCLMCLISNRSIALKSYTYLTFCILVCCINRGMFYFDNSYRPCPLAQQYIGVTVKKPLQRFTLMNEICYNKVRTAHPPLAKLAPHSSSVGHACEQLCIAITCVLHHP